MHGILRLLFFGCVFALFFLWPIEVNSQPGQLRCKFCSGPVLGGIPNICCWRDGEPEPKCEDCLISSNCIDCFDGGTIISCCAPEGEIPDCRTCLGGGSDCSICDVIGWLELIYYSLVELLSYIWEVLLLILSKLQEIFDWLKATLSFNTTVSAFTTIFSRLDDETAGVFPRDEITNLYSNVQSLLKPVSPCPQFGQPEPEIVTGTLEVDPWNIEFDQTGFDGSVGALPTLANKGYLTLIAWPTLDQKDNQLQAVHLNICSDMVRSFRDIFRPAVLVLSLFMLAVRIGRRDPGKDGLAV